MRSLLFVGTSRGENERKARAQHSWKQLMKAASSPKQTRLGRFS